MDSFELNKIIGAILLVALLVIGIGKVSNLAFKVNKPEKAGYKVEVESNSEELQGTEKEIKKEEVDIASVLSTGDLAHGEKVLFLFEQEDDAVRYAMMLEDTDNIHLKKEMDILEVDDDLAIKTCKMHNYKYSVITPDDFVIPPKNDKI